MPFETGDIEKEHRGAVARRSRRRKGRHSRQNTLGRPAISVSRSGGWSVSMDVGATCCRSSQHADDRAVGCAPRPKLTERHGCAPTLVRRIGLGLVDHFAREGARCDRETAGRPSPCGRAHRDAGPRRTRSPAGRLQSTARGGGIQLAVDTTSTVGMSSTNRVIHSGEGASQGRRLLPSSR